MATRSTPALERGAAEEHVRVGFEFADAPPRRRRVHRPALADPRGRGHLRHGERIVPGDSPFAAARGLGEEDVV